MDYPVLYRGDQAGHVILTVQGGRTQVEVSCRRDNGGLFRAYLLCEKGEYPLGVLEPKGENMGLRRTVRSGELQALGTIWRGELRMSYAFSHQTQSQQGSFFKKIRSLPGNWPISRGPCGGRSGMCGSWPCRTAWISPSP